jgi:hypothetical protein
LGRFFDLFLELNDRKKQELVEIEWRVLLPT